MQPPQCHGPQMRATQVTQTVALEIWPQFYSAADGVSPTGWPALRRAMTGWIVAAISCGPDTM
jgi:hypothetical protein